MNITPIDFYSRNYKILEYSITDSDEKIAGMILEFDNCGRDIFLGDLYVNPEYRNKGYATEIVAWLINFARVFCSDKIYLYVPFLSEQAQNIYKKAGFVFTGKILEYCYEMELILK